VFWLFALLQIIPTYIKYGFLYKAFFPVQKGILSKDTLEIFFQSFVRHVVRYKHRPTADYVNYLQRKIN